MLLLIIWLIGGLFSVIPVVDQKQAFIEPSPHDGLMIVLLAACVAARVSFDRKLIPLMLLLIIWLIGGLFSVIPVVDQKQTVQYIATSTISRSRPSCSPACSATVIRCGCSSCGGPISSPR